MTHPARSTARPPGLRRGVFAVAVALSAGFTGAVVAPAHAARPIPSQPLVVLLGDHVARTWPNARAPRIETVRARRPLTGVRTVLPALRDAVSRDRRPWVRVRLPGRPIGHTGWIPAHQTRRTSTEWHLVLDLSARRVTVYNFARVQRSFRVVVGAPSTPTPRGYFFIEEALAIPGSHGGPFALATSTRSRVLQEFEGGPGQIALHGTQGLAGALGSASSHGCIRLSTSSITWLARRIDGGVPLTIVG